MGHRYHHPEPTADLTTVPAAPPLVGLRQPRIAVVGGSLTGPVLALLLLQAGLDNVAVYEASPDIAAATGGVLSLEHTALDVLDRLGIPQHEYVKFGFETITQIRGYGPADDRRTQRQYPGRFTTWTLLHHALASRLPAGVVHHGRRVTAMTAELGAPVLHFADGQRRSADLVAFADGRSSIGRRLLDPGRRLHYAGYVAHRGTAPPRRATCTTSSAWSPAPACSSTSPRYPPAATGSSSSTPPTSSTPAGSVPHRGSGSSPCRSTSAPPRDSRSTPTPPRTCRPTWPTWSTPPPPGWRRQ